MKVEDELVEKKVYLLVLLCKVNQKVSESDMEVIKSTINSTISKKKNKKSSQVSLATESKEELVDFVMNVFEENISIIGFDFRRLMVYSKGWKPASETISETY